MQHAFGYLTIQNLLGLLPFTGCILLATATLSCAMAALKQAFKIGNPNSPTAFTNGWRLWIIGLVTLALFALLTMITPVNDTIDQFTTYTTKVKIAESIVIAYLFPFPILIWKTCQEICLRLMR